LRKLYDQRDNKIEEAYFDVLGTPVECKEQYASVNWRYDARDNQVEAKYFDRFGQPALVNGHARIVRKFDALDQNDRGRILRSAGPTGEITSIGSISRAAS
jgi:hypothetical protein